MATGAAAIAAATSYVATEYVFPAINDHVVPAVNNYIIAVAKEEFKGVWYLRDDVDKTSKLVEAIQEWREVAEKNQLEHESVREWLSDIKNVAYDIEDVVCDYREMVVEAEDGSGVVARWMVQAKDGLFLLCGIPLSCLRDILPLPVTPRIEISRRLRTINKNLMKIEERSVELAKFVGESSGHSNSAATVAPQRWKYEEHPMIGRKKMKAEIKKALLKHSRVRCSKLLVVGIVGAGGMGKTTLAHGIFNDENVKKAFEINKWQYVGEKFDIKKIMNNILDKKDDEKLEDPTELHSEMREKFREKSILIVLDDAWSIDDQEWELLQSSLSNEAKAHTLIATARNKAVTRARCLNSEYLECELVAMPDSECMKVFKSYAFMGMKDAEERFEGLSNQVVKKLKGSPLAARMIGGFLNKYLRNDDKYVWVDIVNNMEWPDTEGNVVDKITGLSYLHLSQPLRSCFAYCSMFPKGFNFEKEVLVQMWIVQGFIQPQSTQLMEHTGKDYFKDLCQMSLLQLVVDDVYTMHDLIHDFAEKIFTEGHQLKASDTTNNLSEKIRHLSIDGREFEPSLNVYGKLQLRTLICDDVAFLNSEDVLANQFRYLRVLILNSDSLEKLPNSIRHLKSLRYLDLSKTQIKSLPKAVCGLINLQCLIVSDEYYKVWPEGMSKLVNLRHLQHPTDIKSIKGIGKLTSLQGYNLNLTILNEDGWRISELKELNHLHGRLIIQGLEHVKSKREAEEACLKDKVYLEGLELIWNLPDDFRQGSDSESDSDSEVVEGETPSSSSSSCSQVSDGGESEGEGVEGETPSSSSCSQDESSRVLEALSLPPFLTSLYIHNLPQLPRWMDLLPSTLVELCLFGCGNWERLPKLGRLPSLKELHINDLKNVRKIGPEFYGGGDGENVNTSTTSFFPRLEEFYLRDMDSLEEWKVPAGVREEMNMNDDRNEEELQHLPTSSNHSFSLFPSLTTLCISDCPKLRTLSSVLPHLTAIQKIDIYQCDELTWLVEQNEDDDLGLSILPSLKADNNVDLGLPQQLPRWVDHLPSTLVHLTLGYCDNWERLPKLGRLSSLEQLEITSLKNVRKIGPEFYGGGGEIVNTSTSSFFPRLERFELRDMRSLEEWEVPARVRGEEINMNDDRDEELQHLPTSSNHSFSLFPSLTYLDIRECPKLRTLSSVLPHLTALTSMSIHYCDEFTWLVEQNEDGDRGLSILPSLYELTIEDCPKLIGASALLSIEADSTVDLGLPQQLPLRMWMDHLPSTLVHLTLVYCDNWERLPKLGRLPSLERLDICDLKNVRKIGPEFYGGGGGGGGENCFFPRLEYFNIRYMRSLEEWEVPAGVGVREEINMTDDDDDGIDRDDEELQHLPTSSNQSFSLFPSLTTLHICNCPKLRPLSSVLPHLRALQELSIWYCPLLEVRLQEGGVDRPKIPATTTVRISR